METTIKGTAMGLNYEIGTQSNGGTWYTVYDTGRVTNTKIDIMSGSSCDKRYTEEYVVEQIRQIMGVQDGNLL